MLVGMLGADGRGFADDLAVYLLTVRGQDLTPRTVTRLLAAMLLLWPSGDSNADKMEWRVVSGLTAGVPLYSEPATGAEICGRLRPGARFLAIATLQSGWVQCPRGWVRTRGDSVGPGTQGPIQVAPVAPGEGKGNVGILRVLDWALSRAMQSVQSKTMDKAGNDAKTNAAGGAQFAALYRHLVHAFPSVTYAYCDVVAEALQRLFPRARAEN